MCVKIYGMKSNSFDLGGCAHFNDDAAGCKGHYVNDRAGGRSYGCKFSQDLAACFGATNVHSDCAE